MIILDDLEEETTEEKREAVLFWFNELPKVQCSVYQGKYYEQSLLELLKETKDGND